MTVMTPDYSRELSHIENGYGVVAGVDEVGRGAWAGPVVAAAIVLPWPKLPDGIRDSKTLSRERRQALAGALHDIALVSIAEASREEVDRLNVHHASLLAMARAIAGLPERPSFALIDGRYVPKLDCPAEAVIKGDGCSLSIAAASIVAKVYRDRLMAQLAIEFPHYGWAQNVGYGTPAHHKALRHYGASLHHRRSFAPVRQVFDQESSITC